MSTNPPVEPAVPKDTLLLIGPIYLGTVANWLLFGISVVQLYIYQMSFANDGRWIRTLVWYVFVLDIYLTVAGGVLGWHILCDGWGRFTNIAAPGWTYPGIVAGDAFVSTAVQMFYAWRIWVLKRWIWVSAMIVIVALMQFAASLSIVVVTTNLESVTQLQPLFPRVAVWLAGSASVDLLIALVMVYVLFSAKSTARIFKNSNSGRMINRLIALTVETGSVTAVCAILELIFFLAHSTKNTNIHVFFALCLGKVYSNTMMATLNSRAPMLQKSSKATTGSSSMSMSIPVSTAHNTRQAHFENNARAPPVVYVTSQTDVVVDGVRPDDKSRPFQSDEIEMDNYPQQKYGHV